jgi:hypothetical protein
MSDATRMQLATPDRLGIDTAVLGEAIESLGRASLDAAACADACLDDPDVRRDCVAACQTLADVGGTAARVLARAARWDRTVVQSLVETAARALSSCASECEEHARSDKHCQVCAESCRRAERACQQLLVSLASSSTADATSPGPS